MDFQKLFEKISLKSKKDLIKEIDSIIRDDKKFLKLKSLAIKSSDNVPDFLEYVYFAYEKEIERFSKEYKIDYDELADIFLGR